MTEAMLTKIVTRETFTCNTTREETLVCLGCRWRRPAFLFSIVKGKSGERGPLCQACFDTKKKDKGRRRRLAKKTRMGAAPTPAPIKRRASLIWNNARLRAWRHGLDFSIGIHWVIDRLVAGHCEVTGLPFDENWGGRPRSNFVPSIDRLVPADGYTESNARMVVWIYNSAKGAGSHDDVVRMASALVKRQAAARAAAKLDPSIPGPPGQQRESSALAAREAA